MKVSRILLIAAVTVGVTACDEDAQFDKELYKKVINVLSVENLTFSVNHDLNQEVSTGYISIGCGGTKHIDQDVTVELEPDNEALAKYNKLNFDIDESKFAHLLDPARYDIPLMSTVLKADSEDNYSTIPVHVRPEGLSPDSIYLIPLRIKSVSTYEINPDKRTVLYRVLLKNDYAFQSPVTTYQTRGLEEHFDAEKGKDIRKSFSLTRYVLPLTKNSIRCFVGLNSYDASKLTKADIRKYAMCITINEDATLTITPMGTAQIEMLDKAGESNYYTTYEKNNIKYQAFYLNYRYRLLKDGKDGSNGDADYDIWYTMEETMIR